jgi:hypothetical protein
MELIQEQKLSPEDKLNAKFNKALTEEIFSKWSQGSIGTEDQFKEAEALRKVLVTQRTSIEKLRKELSKPVQKALKDLKAYGDNLIDMTTKAEKALSSCLSEYTRIKEEEANKHTALEIESALVPLKRADEDFDLLTTVRELTYWLSDLLKIRTPEGASADVLQAFNVYRHGLIEKQSTEVDRLNFKTAENSPLNTVSEDSGIRESMIEFVDSAFDKHLDSMLFLHSTGDKLYEFHLNELRKDEVYLLLKRANQNGGGLATAAQIVGLLKNYKEDDDE